MLRALLFANIKTAGGNEILTVSQSVWNSGYSSESITISITSNTSWEIQNLPSWITASATSGSGNQDVTFTATKNTGEARTAIFTISCESITLEISVSQESSVSTETTTDPGSPEVTTDKETGEVTKYETTEEASGDTTTEIKADPLSGDFKITLAGTFPAQKRDFTFRHLICIMTDRYNGLRIVNYAGYWRFYFNGTSSSNYVNLSTYNGALSSPIVITYQNGTLILTIAGAEKCNKAITFTTNPEIYLCGVPDGFGVTNASWANAITITEFSYEKL